jgi:hypothetical protein
MQFIPNLNLDFNPINSNSFKSDRIDKCILKDKLPLQWEGFNNDLIHIINSLRKEWKCNITETIKLKILFEDEQAYTASLMEKVYIEEETFTNIKLVKILPNSRSGMPLEIPVTMYKQNGNEVNEVNIGNIYIVRQYKMKSIIIEISTKNDQVSGA